MTVQVGFTGGWLDRADHVRTDADALAAHAGDWRARLLRLDGLDPRIDAEGRLEWTSLADAGPDGELVFLGLDDRGRPHFTQATPADRGGGAARSMALFRMLDALPASEAAVFGTARHLIDWHARHRFCAACGTPTTFFRGGWGRKCSNCAAEHYPRVDPVVIMLAEHDDRVLVGRGAAWPAGRYSALAGFIEPGESLEEAVAREIFEEAGVRVSNVRYVASQPWPFPGSLMFACIGTAEDDVLTIDTKELQDARWVSRAGVAAAIAR